MPNNKSKLVLILIFSLISMSSQADIYKYIDKDGIKTIYEVLYENRKGHF